jgi:VanZ family protein
LNSSHPPAPAETRLQFWVRWTITLVWAALIFQLSTETFTGSFSELLLRDILGFLHLTVTEQTFVLLHYLFRKLAHLTEYGIFGVFLYHCFLNSNQTEWSARAAFWAVTVAGLYSLTDEFHQRFVPGRGPSLKDCGIDATGAVLAMLVIFIWTKLFPSRHYAAAAQEDYPAVSS